MMTFEQFQATRFWFDDLAQKLQSAPWGDDSEKPHGYVYLDMLYIEKVMPHWPERTRDKGQWHLLIGNDETISNDLETLERSLYDWAMSEGYGGDE